MKKGKYENIKKGKYKEDEEGDRTFVCYERIHEVFLFLPYFDSDGRVLLLIIIFS